MPASGLHIHGPRDDRPRAKRVPPHLLHLFWNTAPAQLDVATSAPYIARRLLTTFDPDGLAWGTANLPASAWEHAAATRGLEPAQRALAHNLARYTHAAGEGRGPFTVPVWYQYAPGGEAWVLTPAGSGKVRLVKAAGRFTLMVERVLPTVRYVSVEGPVTRMVPGTDELLREITVRYLAPEKVPAYIEFARAELGEQVAIYLRPQRWLSADLGPG